MQDPIGSFLRIRELYISYLDTAFRIRDESVAEERRRLLRTAGELATDPLVEPLPHYEQHRVDSRVIGFEDLIADVSADGTLGPMDERSRRAFVDLVLSGLFPSDPVPGSARRIARFAPYDHQIQMLHRGLRAGMPGIVASGTGSGKTESFLLPILARICQEAVGWDRPARDYLTSHWWQDDSGRPYSAQDSSGRTVAKFVAIPEDRRPSEKHPLATPFHRHREGEAGNRRAAVRALILYPMNALVEDQLVRLRKALDSREARTAMDQHLQGNRITFGRYTSATPVTGPDIHPGLRHLLARKKKDVAGDVYCPSHKDADPAGRVALQDLRTAELERRRRKLAELFEEMVGLERGQTLARLHALDAEAGDRFRRAVAGMPRPLTPQSFLAASESSGKRQREALFRDFRNLVGVEPDGDAVEAIRRLSLRESDASDAPSAFGLDDSPFTFPSIDGGELTNRWDMHHDPPDIFITNVSMLSAMLNREVDQPVFARTREWLEQPGSYFYLVLDELHLQRGAAGTEVAYLIRLLLHRLGLTQTPEQRAKVRVLASSASLPAAPEEEARLSAEYLWDMFGPFGIPATAAAEPRAGKEEWRRSIISGRERPSRYRATRPPRSAPEVFARFLDAHLDGVPGRRGRDHAGPLAAKRPDVDPVVTEAWTSVADSLGIEPGPLAERVRGAIEEVAERVAWACLEPDDHRPGFMRSRAIPASELAERLFDTGGAPSSSAAMLQALRGLLFVRGCGEALGDYLGSRAQVFSFRVHSFFRSIEGLYAPASRRIGPPVEGRSVNIGILTVDQAARIETDVAGRREEHRIFETLYCECCGEMFVGGMRAELGRRSTYLAELLPQEPHLEGLPDQAVSQRFEELSFARYGVFWPGGVDRADLTGNTDPRDSGTWVRAFLEIETGGILAPDQVPDPLPPDLQEGWYYDRQDNRDKHRRSNESAGSQVPYACPSCGTSYSGRSAQYRLSPVRNFRAGFSKTTQLLATELFDAQRVSDARGPTKLVSFSDSRQDAAKAALSIERLHHQDVRRELLLTTIRRAAAQVDLAALRRRVEDMRGALPPIGSPFRAMAEVVLGQAEAELANAEEPSVPISAVLESATDVGGTHRCVSAYVRAMVRLGMHPYDDAGQERPRGLQGDRTFWFPWHALFHEGDEQAAIRWSDDPDRQIALESARQSVVWLIYESLTDVVFSKTYFSFEEAGLGFPSVRLSAIPLQRRSRERVLELAAFLRVVADSYRYWPSPYRRPDEQHSPWTVPGEVDEARAKRFVSAAWPDDPDGAMATILADLEACGHRAGIIRMEQVRIELVNETDRFARCSNCGRVHLHAGAGVCTRCFRPLAWAETANAVVATLRDRNFLAHRLHRDAGTNAAGETPSFRLHCEELTGQTEDQPSRQRQFRGIFLPRLRDVNPDTDQDQGPDAVILSEPNPILRRADEIDLLAVTTTMEVGVDIGSLQIVLQANMPPQRFNYQQRVGRAGRRGQAFSMAVTICRTKSHDLFYFRRPKKITGDLPPTPFLTKRLSSIPRRFLMKAWLWSAFGALRDEVRAAAGVYPADLMSPPDIHGEYLPMTHFPAADGVDWRDRAAGKIMLSFPVAQEVARLLGEGAEGVELDPDPDDLLREIDAAVQTGRREGLAHTLAEAGRLPMYGMPTRMRRMYLGVRFDEEYGSWSAVDRDLDLAIYEFAPGASLVIDKREHVSIGFTPDLGDPIPHKRDQVLKIFQDEPFGERFSLVECGVCRAWFDTHGPNPPPECAACGSILQPEANDCRVPNAFRTDFPFQPPTHGEETDGGVRHRSIQAEGRALDLQDVVGFGPSRAWSISLAQSTGRTFRLNRGPARDGAGRGFEYRRGIETITPRHRTLTLPAQAISTERRLHDKVANTFQPAGAPELIWLASPKTTEALYLAPVGQRAQLALHRLPGRVDSGTPPPEVTRWLGVRAAAMSASYLLASRAALELDIDPEEFDVLEPRLHGRGHRRPLLHITDNLVNGAGYCDYLARADDEGVPRVCSFIQSMLLDPHRYPLVDLLRSDHGACDTSCYRCLRRYGNQPFHALLDWQLGLAFLRTLIDPTFACGLDGDFGSATDGRLPELVRWPHLASRLASEMAQRFGTGEARTFAQVPAFRMRMRRNVLSPWILVAHPLWDWRDELDPASILSRAREDAGADGEPLCWDTFNLARRQVFVREKIRDEVGARA